MPVPARPSAPRALVIGSGIGGLTAAVALNQGGWETTVLERAETLEPVGAGIGLAPNGQRALDVIGLGDDIRELAAWQGGGGIRNPRGRWLSRVDSSAFADRFGGPLVLVHRSTLIDRIASRLPAGAVRTGTAAHLIDPGVPGGRPARVGVEGGELTADLVIAADGIHSAARRALFPAHPGPVYAGFTAWRVVVPAAEHPFEPHETWGPGMLWGTQPLKDGRIYAYAAALTPPGGRADDEKAELLRRFGDWHDPVPAIIDTATTDQVLRNDVHHLKSPLPVFHKGRAVLLGDAAHAMTPMLGQGGNQAIEDAVVLAHHTAPDQDLGAALAAYSAERQPRTAAIVRKSAQVARLLSLSNAPALTVRETLMTLAAGLGSRAAVRAFDGIADWHPPQRTYADQASDGRSAHR
ncbi:FAD-dependent monooxygenase [Streptomyces albipurpureus]|uniref:FAD-dependent monooxygenase n=1 Tax=Streptomyces albipurpureus TaxID=2897419 RepID=A0ABT0UT89_9ACTN|nr:FAD-dependent monooxygenase [Streptomyces sp. CWNU-1]MCM2391606.1 FAD-dependent monooxygenase [Streptomyces sp. CWNU-1]